MARLKFAVAGGLNAEYMLPRASQAEVFKSLINSAKRIEALGFDYYLMGEHQCEDPATSIWSSPAVWMAALAQETNRLKFMPMVFVLPFHNPFRLAQDCAWVDQLSEGRLEAGFGTGSFEHQQVRLNLPFSERRAMSQEAMDVILKAWTQECFTHHGEYYHYDEALAWPQPYQAPHPPVWWPGSSDATLKYAARMNFKMALGGGRGKESVGEMIEQRKIWVEVWKAQGHPGPLPEFMVNRTVYVAETDKEAYEDYKTSFEWSQQKRDPTLSKVGRTKIGYMGTSGSDDIHQREAYSRRDKEGLSYVLESGTTLVGSPETVAQLIKEQQEAIGFESFSVFLRLYLPSDKVEKSFTLFGEKVIPLLT